MVYVKEDIDRKARTIEYIFLRMQARFNNIETRKNKDYALTLLGIAKQVKEATTTATDIDKLCRIATTLYKEYLNLLPYYDYEYEKIFLLSYVEKYGLDLEVLEALQRKNFKKIQEIISNA